MEFVSGFVLQSLSGVMLIFSSYHQHLDHPGVVHKLHWIILSTCSC